MAKSRRGGRRLLLLAVAVALAALMLGTYLALLVAGVIGGGGASPGGGGGGQPAPATTQAPSQPVCTDVPDVDLSVSSVPDYPGLVGYLEAAWSGGSLEVKLHIVNNGTDIVDVPWLKDSGVVFRVYTDMGLQLLSRKATSKVTSIAPGEEVAVTLTASIPEGARPAYVIAAQPAKGFFASLWLVDFKSEAGACGWTVEEYTWGKLMLRWVALAKGLLVLEAAIVPSGGQSVALEPLEPQEPALKAFIYDPEGKPILELTGPVTQGYTVAGGRPFALTAAATVQLAQPDSVKVEFNLAVNGKPLEAVESPFGEWVHEGFPGSWRTGVIRVDGDLASFVATYWYNGYLLVVRTASLVVHENGTLVIEGDFRNTPIGPPSPGAILKVLSKTGVIDEARFFTPQLRGSGVVEYQSTELNEANETVYIYKLYEGSLTLAAWSANSGIKTYAVLLAPYDTIDGVLVETPWGSTYMTAAQLAAEQG